MPDIVETVRRALPAVIAIVVCLWFALGVRQAHDTAAAAAIVSSGHSVSAAQAARATSLLSDAAVLNPDRQVDLLRAELAAESGRRNEARRITLMVARAEPRNYQVWLLLSSIGTPYLAAVAVQRLAKLAPTIRSTP